MTSRNVFIVAAAIATALSIGVASWVSGDNGSEAARTDGQSLLAAPLPAGTSGVAETESTVTPFEAAPDGPPAGFGPRVPTAAGGASATRPATSLRARPTSNTARVEVMPTHEARPIGSHESREVATQPVPAQSTFEAPVEFVEMTVPSGSVLGLRLDSSVSSETASLEDRVDGTVTREVPVDGRVAIPAGTRVVGSVSELNRGGKFKEQARVGIRFHTLVFPDGTRADIQTDAIVHDGEARARATATKIGGGALGGAIIGGIMGGKRGAILGGAAGAGAGTAVVAAGERSVAMFSAGTLLSVRLDAPVTVTVER